MLLSGCVITPDGRVYVRPVVVAAPPPVVVEPAPLPPPAPVVVEVPDDYVWDGYEYIGMVGDQYYYLGPGEVWIHADPFRIDRFHGWIGGHPDWRGHAIRNDRYRRDAHGRVQERRDNRHDHH